MLLFLIAAVFLTGCVESSGKMLGMLVSNGSEGDVGSELEPIEMTLENKLIDMEDPVDERGVLQKAMEEQREILKPGSITEAYGMVEVQVRYYVNDGGFHYHAIYELPGKMPLLFADGMTLYGDDFYDEAIMDFQDAKKFNTKQLKGLYGLYGDNDYPSYQLWGTADGVVYNLNIGKEDGVEHEKVLEMLGKSMKTEADGAYDPFYSTFSLDVTEVKFPSFSKEHTDINLATIRVDGYDDNSELSVTYRIGRSDQVIYTVSEKEKELYKDYYEKEYETEMLNGMVVSEYKDVDSDDRIFRWTDGTYFYEMELWAMDKSLIQSKDMYDIIHSSLQDKRSFDRAEVFAEENTQAELGENEKSLNDM